MKDVSGIFWHMREAFFRLGGVCGVSTELSLGLGSL